MDLYKQLKERQETQALNIEVLQTVLNKAVMRECLINLVTVRSLPLLIVEWNEFHAFYHLLNPEVDIPLSHNTLRSWIQTSFLYKKDIVRKTL